MKEYYKPMTLDEIVTGRPLRYAGHGAPQVSVRLPPHLLQHVKRHGGSAFIRGLIVQHQEANPGGPSGFTNGPIMVREEEVEV